MSTYIDLDGLLISEDGEIIDAPKGSDALTLVAHKLLDAQDQEKQWGNTVRALRAVFLRLQDERKVQYGDVVVSIRQASHRHFDEDGFREEFLDLELTGKELRNLIWAAKDFNPSALKAMNEPDLADLVERHEQRVDNKPFALAERVRKAAPKVRERDDDLEPLLRESIARVQANQATANGPSLEVVK